MAHKHRRTYWLNYFRPNVFIKSFADLNIFLLKKTGVKMLICDLDNTLSPHFTTFPTRKVMEFCHKVQTIGIKLAIVSNNSKKRVNKYVSRLSPDVVIPSAHKPFKRKIMKMLEANHLKASEVMIMGDQFITDVWVANRIGCHSILVLPIVDPSGDTSSNWFVRFLDRLIYLHLEHGNYLKLDYRREGVIDNEYQII